MPVVGCYSVDLYCDRDGGDYGSHCQHNRQYYTGGPQGQFTGETLAQCKREARKFGWSFKTGENGQLCFCPGCTKDLKK